MTQLPVNNKDSATPIPSYIMELPDPHDPAASLLHQYLAADRSRLASVEEALSAGRQTFRDMKAAYEMLEAEVRDLKSDIEAKDGYTIDLRGRFKTLQSDYEDVVQKLKSAEAKCDDPLGRQVLARLEEEIKLRLSLEEKVKLLQDGDSKELKLLKQERDLKEPLVLIGTQIRLRFLEQAKETVWYERKDQLDQAILELGNQAAHCGNGETDAALFALGVIPEAQLASMTKIYEALYFNNPTMFSSGPAPLREVINHKVTILTLRTLNSSLNRPVIERQRTMEQIGIVLEKCVKLKDEALVIEDTDIARRVAAVREGTAVIVDLDRQNIPPPPSSNSKGGGGSKNNNENRKMGGGGGGRGQRRVERRVSSGFGLC